MAGKKTVMVTLTVGQRDRLRELVNDKQDALFAKLKALDDQSTPRADGLRKNLNWLDTLDRTLRDAEERDELLAAAEWAASCLKLEIKRLRAQGKKATAEAHANALYSLTVAIAKATG